jgi:hypothetical protein
LIDVRSGMIAAQCPLERSKFLFGRGNGLRLKSLAQSSSGPFAYAGVLASCCPFQAFQFGIINEYLKSVTHEYEYTLRLVAVEASFEEGDKPVWADPGQHAVVSERLAKLIFRKEDPIRKQVLLWKGQSDRMLN